MPPPPPPPPQAPLTPEQRRAAEEAAGLREPADDKAATSSTLPGGVFLKGEVRSRELGGGRGGGGEERSRLTPRCRPFTPLFSASNEKKPKKNQQRPVPDDAHEYHARKALNDAAYASLAYKPYSSTMPVDPECAEPKWAWTRKGGN
jgi:hypothetical protein